MLVECIAECVGFYADCSSHFHVHSAAAVVKRTLSKLQQRLTAVALAVTRPRPGAGPSFFSRKALAFVLGYVLTLAQFLSAAMMNYHCFCPQNHTATPRKPPSQHRKSLCAPLWSNALLQYL